MAGKVTQERLDEARLMLEDGASIREVCTTLGMHKDTIFRHIPEAKPWTPAQRSAHGVLVRQANRKIKKQFAHLKTV